MRVDREQIVQRIFDTSTLSLTRTVLGQQPIEITRLELASRLAALLGIEESELTTFLTHNASAPPSAELDRELIGRTLILIGMYTRAANVFGEASMRTFFTRRFNSLDGLTRLDMLCSREGIAAVEHELEILEQPLHR